MCGIAEGARIYFCKIMRKAKADKTVKISMKSQISAKERLLSPLPAGINNCY